MIPMDVGKLISGSSAFSKSSLYTWKFSVHILLKASLKNFEHYFASMWNEYNRAVVWTFFGIGLWDWNENWSFPVLWPLLSFPNLLAYRVQHFNSIIFGFKIAQLESRHFHQLCSQWCFIRPTWLCTPGCLALGEWSHHHGYLAIKIFFVQFFCVFLPPLLKIFCFC